MFFIAMISLLHQLLVTTTTTAPSPGRKYLQDIVVVVFNLPVSGRPGPHPSRDQEPLSLIVIVLIMSMFLLYYLS